MNKMEETMTDQQHFKYNPDEQNKFSPSTVGASFLTIPTEKLFLPQAGQYKLRILPPWSPKGLFAKFMKTHWRLGIQQIRTVCPDMYVQGTCPFCHAHAIMRNDYKKYQDDINAVRAVDRYFSNIVNLGEPQRGVIVWAYGKTVYKQLKGIQDSGDFGDITDVDNGSDITLIRSGSGQQVQDTIYPVRQPTRIQNPNCLNELYNLDSIFKEPDVDAIIEAFDSQPWLAYGALKKENVVKPKTENVVMKQQEERSIPAPQISPTPLTNTQPDTSKMDKLKELEKRLREKMTSLPG
jgi:hypothetical protein